MSCWRVLMAGVMITACASAVPAAPLLAQAPPDSPPRQPLPAQGLNNDATTAAFLDQARLALAAGRTGAAQEALERAETRALARSVRPSQARVPSQQSVVQKIAEARRAVLAGDRQRALDLIGEAEASQAANPE